MPQIHLEKALFTFTAAAGRSGRERRHRPFPALGKPARPTSAMDYERIEKPSPPVPSFRYEDPGYRLSVFGFDFSACFVGFRFILVRFEDGVVEERDVDWRWFGCACGIRRRMQKDLCFFFFGCVLA